MDFSLNCSPGEQKHFLIPVPDADAIEAVIVQGAFPGKTLVVTAGVHGCEYVGIQAVQEILQELRPQELFGRVLLVPLVNAAGFYAGTDLVPADRNNLNRCFPGSARGGVTQRMAYALEQVLYKEADFLLDLHGGGSGESMTPLVFFPVGAGKKIEREARRAASCLSLSYRVPSVAKNGLYSYAAQQQIPSLLVERGGGGTWHSDEVAACKQNIYELMGFLGIGPASPITSPSVELEQVCYEEAPEDGFWYCYKTPDSPCRRGELLGKLVDRYGKTIDYRANFDGVVLYFTHSLGVQKGGALIAYGKPYHV